MSSPLVCAIFSTLPNSPKCAVPTRNTTPTSGLAISHNAAISPRWRAPISRMQYFVSGVHSRRVIGAPSSLLKDAFVEMAKILNKKIVFLPEDAKLFSDFNEQKHFVLESDKFNSGFDVITWEEIDANFIVQFKFSERELYNKIKVKKQIIQSGGEPLGEFDPNWNVLKQYCKENAIDFSVFSNSGHATPENLKYIADQIDATILIPIHSYKPDLLKPINWMQRWTTIIW